VLPPRATIGFRRSGLYRDAMHLLEIERSVGGSPKGCADMDGAELQVTGPFRHDYLEAALDSGRDTEIRQLQAEGHLEATVR